MGTGWSEIVTNSAMVFIDDVRLQEAAADNPALFFRRMSLYVDMAIPMLSRPPELLSWLQCGMTPPTYGDYEWVADQTSTTTETEVSTGMIGYELFSCVARQTDLAGNVTTTQYLEASYNAETGVVTFPQQNMAGVSYDMDFYTDGTFSNTLTATQIRLLGLATACVWDERFSRNWLNIQMKIHDQSFMTANESSYMREATSRAKVNRALFNDELRKYEQDCAYQRSVLNTNAWV